jgi:hypothetical protein
MQFHQPSHHFVYITAQLFHTFNLCPSLNTTDQDCNIHEWQVKLHITFLNHYNCIQEIQRQKVHFTLTESHKLHTHTHIINIQQKGMGCNTFETAQSHNGCRLMQNRDKDVLILITILSTLTTDNTLAPSTQVKFFHCGYLQHRV